MSTEMDYLINLMTSKARYLVQLNDAVSMEDYIGAYKIKQKIIKIENGINFIENNELTCPKEIKEL